MRARSNHYSDSSSRYGKEDSALNTENRIRGLEDRAAPIRRQRDCAKIVPLLGLVLIFSCVVTRGDANSWTNPASGNWEDSSSWLSGVIPGSGQDVFLTNAGWKAVQISPVTARDFPQSLTVNSITVSSPTNSFNTLLLNFAGFDTPLATRLLTIASNSAMTMLSSKLNLNGYAGEGVWIGGEFNQADSLITGPQVDVGYIGPGAYNLSSGLLDVGQIFLGGSHPGDFNQYGGDVRIGLLHLRTGGVYNFYGGEFAPTNIYFEGGTFFQRGGVLNPIFWNNGPIRWKYVLKDGINNGGFKYGVAVQLGGTNFGPLFIGSDSDNQSGWYTMSNGVSVAELRVHSRGRYEQWGGSQTATGVVNIDWGIAGRGGGIARGLLQLNGGTFSAAGISAGGYYIQNGGTNVLSGPFTLNDYGSATLNAGVLMDNDVALDRFNSEFKQYGGIHVVTNQLTITGPQSLGVDVRGAAQLIVSNIVLIRNAPLRLAERTLVQSGTISCGTGIIFPGQGSHQFGRLRMDVSEVISYNGTSWLTNVWTNSIVSLPLNSNCVVRFREGSTVPWTNTARLQIANWAGLSSGNGTHQIIFGSDSNALTPQQLSQILFANPAGFPTGSYPAKILATGEIVPAPMTGHVAPLLALLRQTNGTVRLSLQGEFGGTYGIDVTTNFADWTRWTNLYATNGSATATDGDVMNQRLRFYRAVLLP